MKPKLYTLLLVLQCHLILLFLATAVSGQVRLYDQASDELARKTRDAFADFSKGDANVFETMVTNTLTLKEATLAHLSELNRQGTRDTVNLVPLITWKKLREENVRRTQKEFLDAYNATRIILNQGAGSTDLKAALAAANADLAALKTQRATKEKELSTTLPDLNNLKDSLDKLKDSLAAASKPVSKLSDLGSEFTNLKTVWTNISAVKVWWDTAEKSANAPGLQLTILDLAIEHQQGNVDRLKLDLEEASAAVKRAERI
jgi:hypothetical protein